ncbi:hypothetical protein HELRODRAFT_147564, partial [Helobdella robusta]|uniref:Reverse transcriptase domain-containing protein n=1 Tax=Helobdella robusta TaxID=6412 RepID=T1EK14_HELRO
TVEELTKTLKAMKDGKAAGPSGLTNDIIKASGTAGIQTLLQLCREIWRNCSMPTEWNYSMTVPLYKGKGYPLNCSSYRGIRLL